MGATIVSAILAFIVVTTMVLLVIAAVAPASRSKRPRGAPADSRRPRIRLLSQLLFTGRHHDAITIDCLLVAVEQAGPGVGAPAGLPFTLQFRTPDTGWFADRVELLLTAWADERRELTLELHEDHGIVRTMITSGDSALHLELAGAAGLSLTS